MAKMNQFSYIYFHKKGYHFHRKSVIIFTNLTAVPLWGSLTLRSIRPNAPVRKRMLRNDAFCRIIIIIKERIRK